MAETPLDPRVLVVRCEGYDAGAIEQIVADGMGKLGYRPQGKVFVKPNVVFAGKGAMGNTVAMTNRALLGACLSAVAQDRGVERIDVGENSGIGFPTMHCYRNAGYVDEVKRARKNIRCPVDLYCMDEDLRDSVFVGGRVHDNLRVSRRMARADTKIYLPKLKCHCVSNMTGAVKLNVGICSDDERSIRHDFLLDEKIVDLLTPGWPDFVVMDAIDIGVGNEAFPIARKLGLLLMGRNPMAVDLVAARLLGYDLDDVPYLRVAVDRGYGPGSLDEVQLLGDLTSLEEIDEQAKRVQPYDEEFRAWQDLEHDLKRLQCPIRLHWGPFRGHADELCRTGCIMGLKMFLAAYEALSGPDVFRTANPCTFVIGRIDEPIDGQGNDVFLLGSCAKAEIRNARDVVQIDKCFTTASDMTFQIGHRMGMPSPLTDPKMALPLVRDLVGASLRKGKNLRYLQDIKHWVSRGLIRKV